MKTGAFIGVVMWMNKQFSVQKIDFVLLIMDVERLQNEQNNTNRKVMQNKHS